MNEAKLTKKIISFLKSTGWNIIAFDYPQSGTGKNFKSSSRCVKENQKNKEHIIPDILAVKNKVMILFENKANFYFDDFQKINTMIKDNCYEESINEYLVSLKIEVEEKFYGIGASDIKSFYDKAKDYYTLTNFVLNVNEKGMIITYNPHKIDF